MDTVRLKRWVTSKKWGRALGVILKRKKYKDEIFRQLKERLDDEPSKWQVNWCYHDYLRFHFKYGGNIDTDYFGTQLYKKSDFVRNESFATQVRFPWRDSVQERVVCSKFQDKREFYRNFSEYLGRDWMIVDENTAKEEILQFLQNKEGVFAKIPVSCGGKDVHYFHTQTDAEKKEIFNFCKNGPVVLENSIEECEELHCFSNYTAVNTLRIITIVDSNGNPHIAAAILRIGRDGSAVDNYSSGGMSALVDIDTGIVYTQATNKKGKTYIVHPDSGKQIVGFIIPEWEKYKEFAVLLAKKYPTMRYVGWDIVKDKQGRMCVIEGNKDAGADYVEAGLLYGLLPHYNKLLNMN